MLPTEEQSNKAPNGPTVWQQQTAAVASLGMGVNTTTPVIRVESKKLITQNSFNKSTPVITTDISGITKHVCIHNVGFL